MLFLPESPRFYAKVGKIDKAEEVLMLLRISPSEPADPSQVSQELEEIQNSISSELKTGFCTNMRLLFLNYRYQAITGIGLLSL